MIDETKDRVNGAGVENCDFPEEKDCYQVGGSVITASSPAEERKLVFTEEHQFGFSNYLFIYFGGWGVILCIFWFFSKYKELIIQIKFSQ